MTKKGLLLGAGFSYDFGMPLVKDVTEKFFEILNPTRIDEYQMVWKGANPYGSDYPIDSQAVDDIVNILKKHQVYIAK
ncbi:hypothetical protein B0H94_12230 [Salsuginibacillus halophilus]|uniref:Uncharacterized protein n=1 Tax=Salsuginibacillus halophilus TaxID=517424 RepID=A0A2P8H3N8_9BACI|nr:hypothetical protein [Salsuginibacillus halophilus]PSL40835.1 hypothetical protein B0H94_12230 [Salsuginibacillus halophilus]